jgi:hypothetical protein
MNRFTAEPSTISGEELRYPSSFDGDFALCLTHDVDTPFKLFYNILYHGDIGFKRNPLREFKEWIFGQPFHQFDDVMELEDKYGVRSAFNFLNEQSIIKDRKFLEVRSLGDLYKLFSHYHQYDITDERIRKVIQELKTGDWEIGLHGSYETKNDKNRLEYEVSILEELAGEELKGGRQHYWRLDIPSTWNFYQDVGLSYDTSLGSGNEFGFHWGYGARRPFEDKFVVFPTTIMDDALLNDIDSLSEGKQTCSNLLIEASENNSIMTVDWHLSRFNQQKWPNHTPLYEHLIQTALDMDAWVGPPGDLYEVLDAEGVIKE